MDLPDDDEAAGLPERTQLVANAIGDRKDVVLVAQSLDVFTAAPVPAKVPIPARLRERDDALAR